MRDIDATDSDELSTALRQLAGGLSSRISSVRDDLLNLLADLEAGLDFVEEDIEFVSAEETIARLSSAAGIIAEIEQTASDRMQARTHARVVLAGLPNAGKSTLFNALLEREAAIVSDQSGTTRDYLSATVRWGRLDIELIDTAGWEFEQAGIESVAQHFRDEQIQEAEIVVWCSAATLAGEPSAIDRELCSRLPAPSRVILVQTQSDRLTGSDGTQNATPTESNVDPANISSSPVRLAVSAVTRDGLSELQQQILTRLATDTSGTGELLGSTAARSRSALRRAITSLHAGGDAARVLAGDELVAVEVREAITSLGEVVGAVYTDDLLDRIFSRFCIGK